MSECSGAKFAFIQRYFQLKFKDLTWDLEGIGLESGFEWSDKSENNCIPEIISFLRANISDYQFIDATKIKVVVEYACNDTKAVANGYLDIATLLPREVFHSNATILSQCVCVIEVKTAKALEIDTEKCINQSRLQLLALNMGGNDKYPFALLTNVTNYWHFSWLSSNNTVHSVFFDNQNQGLAALQVALQMMNGQSSTCPFTERCGLSFPHVGGGAGGTYDDIADMSQFYDDMTELEIFQHKSKVGLSRFFQLLSPSQRANIAV